MTRNLFGDEELLEADLGPGAFLLRGFALRWEGEVLGAVRDVAERAPFRNMVTPGGYRMSVAMTICGELGWVTDRRGYRYDARDPKSGLEWPSMPGVLLEMASKAASEAGFEGFAPDACLINRYELGAKMSLHQDKDEKDFGEPIVSVSLGVPAVFLFGGMSRGDKALRVKLEHGDVVVWGGETRLRFHGVMGLKEGRHPSFGSCRTNLTFRKAG